MEGDTPQVSPTPEAKSKVKDVSQTPPQPPVVPQTPLNPAPPPESKKGLIIIILIVLLALIGLSVGGFFIWKNISVPETKKTTEKTEEEVYIYKGVWLPGINPNWLATHIQEMKDLGMNTVYLAVMINQEEGNPLVGLDKSHIVDDIQTAHRNNMKVMLTTQIYPKPRLEEKDLKTLNSLILEAAKLAEENNVELFAPLAEPDTIISGNIGRWRQVILSKVKTVYHGEIFWAGCGAGPSLPDKQIISQISKQPSGNYIGYDYIGFPLLFPISERLEPEEQIQFADMLTLEKYSEYVEGALDYMLALAKRDNCKGVIIQEFGVMDRFFMGESGVVDLLDTGWLSEEEIARANEIVLEKGKDRAVGFINANFLGGEIPGRPGEYIEGVSETEKELIRRWFREILLFTP
jgi:hypothetical protein